MFESDAEDEVEGEGQREGEGQGQRERRSQGASRGASKQGGQKRESRSAGAQRTRGGGSRGRQWERKTGSSQSAEAGRSRSQRRAESANDLKKREYRDPMVRSVTTRASTWSGREENERTRRAPSTRGGKLRRRRRSAFRRRVMPGAPRRAAVGSSTAIVPMPGKGTRPLRISSGMTRFTRSTGIAKPIPPLEVDGGVHADEAPGLCAVRMDKLSYRCDFELLWL